MPLLDSNDLLDKLTAFMGTAAGVEYTNAPRALWQWQAVEKDVPRDADGRIAPYSVLRIFGGGSRPWTPTVQIGIQCETKSLSDQAAMARARLLFNTLLDVSGRALRMQVLPATGTALYRLNGVLDLGEPGLVGKDESGRAIAVFNFNVQAVPLA